MKLFNSEKFANRLWGSLCGKDIKVFNGIKWWISKAIKSEWSVFKKLNERLQPMTESTDAECGFSFIT